MTQMQRTAPRSARPAQRGNTILLVLVLLSVMLVGALGMSRMAEVSTLAGGNAAGSDGALQASEVGVNTGFAAVQTLANEDVAIAGWYWPTMQVPDANGVPQVSWTAARAVATHDRIAQALRERGWGQVSICKPQASELLRHLSSLESSP